VNRSDELGQWVRRPYGWRSSPAEEGVVPMTLVIVLVVLALVLGGLGLLVEGLLWLLAIAALLVIVGAVLGFRGRGSTTGV